MTRLATVPDGATVTYAYAYHGTVTVTGLVSRHADLGACGGRHFKITSADGTVTVAPSYALVTVESV